MSSTSSTFISALEFEVGGFIGGGLILFIGAGLMIVPLMVDEPFWVLIHG